MAAKEGLAPKSRRNSRRVVSLRSSGKPATLRPLNQKPSGQLHVYGFGGNSGGELGTGSASSASVYKPELNHELDKLRVVQVATGGMHGVAITVDNTLISWGVNDHGALGRETAWEGVMVDIMEDDDDAKDGTDSDVDSEGDLNPRESHPGEVDVTDVPEGTIFTQVAAGDNSSFAVTETGLLYGWGTFRSNDGDLRFSPTTSIQAKPTLISELTGVKKVACGRNHVIALKSDGSVYSWGIGTHSQLGRRFSPRVVDWRKDGLVPRKVAGLKDIADIGTGSDHSFAIDQNGLVWSWGLNNKGQTGTGGNIGEDGAVVILPTPIKGVQTRGRISQVTGSNFHSIATTTAGECLTWGRLDAYATGLPFEALHEDDILRDDRGRPSILRTPTVIPGLNVAYVAAGSDHSLAVTTDGRAYAWGFNNDGQTGQRRQFDEIEVATLIDALSLRDKKLTWAGAGGQYSMVGAEEDLTL